jgi:transposase
MRIRIIDTSSHKQAVQVVSKIRGKFTLHKHFGTFENNIEKQELLNLAKEYIQNYTHQTNMFSDVSSDWKLDDVEIINSQPLYLYKLLTQVYDSLGFGGDLLIRDLVVARVYQPASKRETGQLLTDVFSRPYSLQTIYRHLKLSLSKGLKDNYQQALINYAKTELHDTLRLVFYDVTTLAFASQTKTTLKDFGYSKDHRSQDTQIVLGLVVNQQGFPLYFDVFSGNTFEGGTFIGVVLGVQKLLNNPDLVVVADAGMLSLKNMDELSKAKIQFVVGARISSLSVKMVDQIVKILDKKDKANTEVLYKNYRLLADYSTKRASKDIHDLTKQWEKAKTSITKPDNLTRRYRFITGSKKTNYSLNTSLKEKAENIAGIKGYLTNTKLSASIITEKYHDLWKVEKAFRITKSDLEARPIFLRLDETIKAHITIIFASLAISRILEIQTGESIHEILKTTSRIFTHTVQNKKTKQITTLETKHPESDICGKLNKIYRLGY